MPPTSVDVIEKPALVTPAPSLKSTPLDIEHELTTIYARLGKDITESVERALTRYQSGLRVGTGFTPQMALRHFWQPALDLLEFIEEKGGSPTLLISAIQETTQRVLGDADQRPQTFVSYTRTIVNNGLGKKGRDWQTNAEEKAANSPEALVKKVSKLLRECMAPVERGDRGKKAIDAARALFKEKFPSDLRERIAETFFEGDQRRSDACLTLAIKQGNSSFTMVTPEEATGIDFLPAWYWPANLKTNRQLEDERRLKEDIRGAEEAMPSWEELREGVKTPGKNATRAQTLLTGIAVPPA